MTLKRLLPSISLLLLTACSTVSEKPVNVLINPEKGVLCDSYICVDQQGVSIELTEHYLGSKPAEALLKAGKFDTSAMTFANGIFCDTTVKLCYIDRYFNAKGERSAISPEYTKALFQK